jgi:hypothetical protein
MKFLVLTLMTGLVGCAAYKNYNQSTTGTVVYRGGIYKNDSWSDQMHMRRMSWYHGMTLYYDAIIWQADPESPFAKWFSASEKEYFSKCENLIVSAAYSADPTKISHVNFREQMKLNGYDDVVINGFASYFKGHPTSIEWRFQNYKIIGFCKRSPSRLNTSRLAINFPAFKQTELDP